MQVFKNITGANKCFQFSVFSYYSQEWITPEIDKNMKKYKTRRLLLFHFVLVWVVRRATKMWCSINGQKTKWWIVGWEVESGATLVELKSCSHPNPHSLVDNLWHTCKWQVRQKRCNNIEICHIPYYILYQATQCPFYPTKLEILISKLLP